jgi:hypothetical protein
MVTLLVRSMGASGIRDAIAAWAALPLLVEAPAKLDFPDEAVKVLESDVERPEVVMALVRSLGGGGSGRDQMT